MLGARLALLALLVGSCGWVEEPLPEEVTASPGAGAAPLAHTLVAIRTATAAGGQVSATAFRLDRPGIARVFVGQFESARFARRLLGDAARVVVPEGEALVGAVVSVGCEVPERVSVLALPTRVAIRPVPTGQPSSRECLAPMTSVALVLVPESSVLAAGAT